MLLPAGTLFIAWAILRTLIETLLLITGMRKNIPDYSYWKKLRTNILILIFGILTIFFGMMLSYQ